MGGRRLLAIALLVGGCGASAPSPTAPPTPAPTPVATSSPSPSPSLSSTDVAAAHITASVTELMGLSDNAAIAAWIDAESAWTDTVPLTVTMRPYFLALTRALTDVAFMDDSTDLRVTALGIIDAAREVPGVELP